MDQGQKSQSDKREKHLCTCVMGAHVAGVNNLNTCFNFSPFLPVHSPILMTSLRPGIPGTTERNRLHHPSF